jgi:hypothetical protein
MNMNVIVAPESINNIIGPCCFLAGGITNCPEWQTGVIRLLEPYEGILFNPRRANFPIHDPNAAREQIAWEFKALERADVFSMWFSNAPSDQPICFYELGRHLALRRLYADLGAVVIGVEPGFKRSQDVYIQTELVSPKIIISDNLEQYAKNILTAMRAVA